MEKSHQVNPTYEAIINQSKLPEEKRVIARDFAYLFNNEILEIMQLLIQTSVDSKGKPYKEVNYRQLNQWLYLIITSVITQLLHLEVKCRNFSIPCFDWNQSGYTHISLGREVVSEGIILHSNYAIDLEIHENRITLSLIESNYVEVGDDKNYNNWNVLRTLQVKSATQQSAGGLFNRFDNQIETFINGVPDMDNEYFSQLNIPRLPANHRPTAQRLNIKTNYIPDLFFDDGEVTTDRMRLERLSTEITTKYLSAIIGFVMAIEEISVVPIGATEWVISE
jgi:hypothetical protein